MEAEQQSKDQHDFNEWLLHPLTKRLFAAAGRRKELLKEQWASGAFTDLSEYGTTILNAKAIGSVEILDWLVGVEVQDLFNEES